MKKLFTSPYHIFLGMISFVALLIQLGFTQVVHVNNCRLNDNEGLINPLLVNKFYQQYQKNLFWFSPGEKSIQLRQKFLNLIESGKYLGLDRDDYHYKELLSSFSDTDSLEIIKMDRLFTDAALSYGKDIFTGAKLNDWLSYDGISEKYNDKDNNYLINKLLTTKSVEELDHFFKGLEPKEKEYEVLKNELCIKLQPNDTIPNDLIQIHKLSSSLNFFRWMHHFQFDKFIVVNIASATLRYYENDSAILKMKIVVGKTSTKTPRFAAYCNDVILYPYWNVPHSIAVNELLPLFKFRPALIEGMNMQVIDDDGTILNPDSLKWSSFNKYNFPYKFRQSTGCDNALGVMKFNLTSPFSVYMHDTNLKAAFQSNSRYLSHGCIRLEKPIELGNYLLHNKLDTTFLKSCLKNQEPISLTVDKSVPVFVVYITAEADETDVVKYHKDVYSLLK